LSSFARKYFRKTVQIVTIAALQDLRGASGGFTFKQVCVAKGGPFSNREIPRYD